MALFTIEVTQKDIDTGSPDIARCPLAKAISRACGMPYFVVVDTFRRADGFQHFPLSKDMRDYRRAFDRAFYGLGDPVVPTSFQLEVPETDPAMLYDAATL